MEDVGYLACKICKSTHENSPMLICDRCADALHQDCIHLPEVPSGMFICDNCEK